MASPRCASSSHNKGACMTNSTLQIVAVLFLLIVFVANALVRRRTQSSQRPLAALDMLPRIASQSVETYQPLHVALSDVALGNRDTVLALVGAEFVYESARALAIGNAPALVTMSDPTMLPLSRDALRRAYQLHKQRTFLNVRWYPTALGLAATATALQRDDRVTGNVFFGNYGAELALPLLAAARHRHPSIAASARLEGQAVAFALADGYLLGEEMFAAAGYLSQDIGLLNRTTTLDVLRWLVVIGVVVWFIAASITGA